MKSAMNLFGIKKTQEGSVTGLDDFLTALPEQLGYQIRFSKTDKGESGLHYEIEGEEVDSFVSNSSEILDALSHLAMRVQRKTEGLANEPVTDESKENFRITFDAGGFRDRKGQELRDMAAEKRTRVMESGGKPAYIPALSPSDRKIIHTHLADLGDVVSESIGKGNFKRIRIRLKDDTRRISEPGAEGERPQANGNSQSAGGYRGNNANGGGNGGGRRGGGRGNGGGGGGGRGPGGGGRGRNDNRGPRQNNNNGGEVDGNRVQPVQSEEHYVDENIGNRLRPGEEAPFQYGSTSGNNFGQND